MPSPPIGRNKVVIKEDFKKLCEQAEIMAKALREIQRGIYDFGADVSLEAKNFVYGKSKEALDAYREE